MPKKSFIIGGIVTVLIIVIAVISSQKPNYKADNSANTSQSTSGQNQIVQTNSSQNMSSSSATFETIATVQDLKKRLDAKNPNEILLDVRTPEEFTARHIAGAVNLDIENVNFTSQIQKLDKTKTYLVFCRSGNRALVASQEMSKIGLKTVYSKGGITLWQSAGFEVVK